MLKGRRSGAGSNSLTRQGRTPEELQEEMRAKAAEKEQQESSQVRPSKAKSKRRLFGGIGMATDFTSNLAGNMISGAVN